MPLPRGFEVTVTRLYLVRHAESLPDDTIPEPDWPLSGDGHQQARALVAKLATVKIDQIYSSPYIRAIDTVEPLAEARGLPISIDHDLRERKMREGFVADWFTVAEGLWQDLTRAMPNCESGIDCQQRVLDAIETIADRHNGESILIASHGNAIALVLNKLDAAFGYKDWRAMRNPHVFAFSFDAKAGLRRDNWFAV